MKRLRSLLHNRRGELLIESVLAMVLLVILFAAVLLMITTSLSMVNRANASARAQQASLDYATRQDFLRDSTGRHFVITFSTDIPTLEGSADIVLSDADGFVAFAGG